MHPEQFHFLTGRLAEFALREILGGIAKKAGFRFTIQTMPISVAALMTPDWIAKNVSVPAGTDRVIIPGYCHGDLSFLSGQFGVPFERGPKDLRRLSEFFGGNTTSPDLENHSIEIIAEINHAPAKTIAEVSLLAKSLADDGADLIDIGCVPGHTCREIGDYVRAVKDLGLRVSIDTLDIAEIELATEAGADLVLSVNSTNRHAAADWGVEVVVIPDDISNLDSMQTSVEQLVNQNIEFRVDPILEPIGLGFAASLDRYFQARATWPNTEMMMGIGNLTELSDVDSAGINFLLLGICEELNIRSVLTTQVINWARSSVAECNFARKLVHHAHQQQIPPKNLSGDLICLRDAGLNKYSAAMLEELARQIKDHNYRIFADQNQVHLIGSGQKFSDADPFKVFDQLAATNPKNLDASHAFYLGYELCKAMTAMQLGKNYIQDESLNWGHLTKHEENRHRLSRRNHNKQKNGPQL